MRIGVGVAYYGGKSLAHAESCRALLRAGIPLFAVRGFPYPELGRAEIIGDALANIESIDVLVIIDHDVVFTVDDVREVADLAVSEGCVASASAGRPRPGRSQKKTIDHESGVFRDVPDLTIPWDPRMMNGCAFTAIPRAVLEALKAAEDRTYTNTARVGTGLSKNARPVFSPWQKSPGTLHTIPIEAGFYSDPDTAFLARVRDLGFRVIDHGGVTVSSSAPTSYSVRVANAPSTESEAKQRANGISCHYAVCVPSFGPLDFDQQAELWELEKAGVTIVELSGCPHVDLARSELVRVALGELECDGVFFLDHDIMFRPTDLLDLVREAEARQDVVSGIYCMRKTAHALIGAPDVEVGGTVGFFDLGGVIPAYYSGLGFAAIPRAVFDALDKHLPLLDGGFTGKIRPYFALDVNGNFYSGEDVSFCSRVTGLTVKHVPGNQADGVEWELGRGDNRTGHKIFIDTRKRIFHRGLYDYGVEDHSFAVPRLAKLEAKHAQTREEVRAVLRDASELPPEVIARAIGVDEGSTAMHGGVES